MTTLSKPNKQYDELILGTLLNSKEWEQLFADQIKQSICDVFVSYSSRDNEYIENMSKKAIRNIRVLLENNELRKEEAEFLLTFVTAELVKAKLTQITDKYSIHNSKNPFCRLLEST